MIQALLTSLSPTNPPNPAIWTTYNFPKKGICSQATVPLHTLRSTSAGFLPTLSIPHHPPFFLLLAIKSKLNLEIIFSKKAFLAIFHFFSHPISTLTALNAFLFCCTLCLPLVEHLPYCIINCLFTSLSLSS